MSLDAATVRRMARLARIRVEEADLGRMADELGAILHWIEQLDELDVSGIEPLTGPTRVALRLRDDLVDDGGHRDDLLRNAPDRKGGFFAVPKVVE